jgi:hypothetical protein
MKETVQIITSIAYPPKGWRDRNDEKRLEFTIPTHSDLIPYLRKPDAKSVNCYYRNLKCKYSQLRRGTPIRIEAEIEVGARGGLLLHIKSLDVLNPDATKDLNGVSSEMLDRWERQIMKKDAGIKAPTTRQQKQAAKELKKTKPNFDKIPTVLSPNQLTLNF